MQKQLTGFTLIEVIIVVAIIAVLASVAVPLYQGSILKAQVNRAVSELGAYKSVFDIQVTNGGSVGNSELGYVPSHLTNGTIATDIGVANSDGSGHIEVTMGGSAHPNLAGVVLRFERDIDGGWACKIDKAAADNWRSDYRPSACVVL